MQTSNQSLDPQLYFCCIMTKKGFLCLRYPSVLFYNKYVMLIAFFSDVYRYHHWLGCPNPGVAMYPLHWLHLYQTVSNVQLQLCLPTRSKQKVILLNKCICLLPERSSTFDNSCIPKPREHILNYLQVP